MSLNSVAHFSYVLVARRMLDEHSVWNYLSE